MTAMKAKPFHAQNVLIRACEIARVSLRYFMYFPLTREADSSFGRRTRLACEKLGPVFVKLGQLLSSRSELLSSSDRKELQKLLDKVPPVPHEEIEQIFLADFGKRPEECYAFFDSKPIASASIAQVYRGRLKSGKDIAIKVRRPGIDRTVSADLSIMHALVRIAQRFSSNLRHVNAEEIFRQLKDWMQMEMDFMREVENIETATSYYDERLKKNEEPYSKFIVFPEIYRELCSQNVITMEFLDGVPMSAAHTIGGNREYDASRSLRSLMKAVIRSWLSESHFYFHGDPHPANILIMKNGYVGLIDLGLLGFFDKKQCDESRNLFLAVYAKNVDEAVVAALKMCKAPYGDFALRIRNDVVDYVQKTEFEGIGFWFMGFIKIFMRHRVPLPYCLVLFGRMNALFEGLANMILPGETTLDILGDDLAWGLRRRIIKNVMEMDFAPVLL